MIPAVATLTMEELKKSEPSNLHTGPVKGADGIHGISQAPYIPDTLKWLPIGAMYDHPKSWTFMGGGVAPAEGAVILYTVEINEKMYYPDEFACDRKERIGWFLRDGYQPCPVSVWHAENIRVKIQHFAVRNQDNTGTLIYSSIDLENQESEKKDIKFLINASPKIHLPLMTEPDFYGTDSMEYQISLKPGALFHAEFVSHVCGEALEPEKPEIYGTFEENYKRMAEANNLHIKNTAHPVCLPENGIADMYKAIQIQLWNYVVEKDGECQIRSNAGNPARIQSYDRPFPHDVPNFVDQFIREGDYELAKQILSSDSYRKMNSSDIQDWDGLNYMDTIGKFMLPYAQYLQNTGDEAYFDEDMMDFLKEAARNIHRLRVYDDAEHEGLMKKGEDFENWSDDGDYLLADNWAALHGLQAYHYIVDRMGREEEKAWVEAEMDSLNDALNKAIRKSMERRNEDYYLGAFDDVAYQRYIAGSFYSWVPYSAGLATFPWGAELQGMKLGGVWKEKFDAALEYALEQRDLRMLPEGSWGAWWSKVTYGSVYNASAGVQCLYSEKHRTEAIKNVEFLYENQCAPFVWSEAFESKGKNQWAGMYLPQESYGNYEGWGSSFIKQAILQACVSARTDGTVILGRGIPDEWLQKGDCIAWKHVNVNDGRVIDFAIETKKEGIKVKIEGDYPKGDIILDLPLLRNQKVRTSVGEVLENGTVKVRADVREFVVTLIN